MLANLHERCEDVIACEFCVSQTEETDHLCPK
jgi:hypothetical protein